MTTAVSMLRGINVGGARKVPMEELRRCYESLGYTKVRTYIQSGNVVFDYRGTDSEPAARNLETELERRFGFKVAVIIRTSQEMHRIIENFPFTRAEEEYAHVTFMSTKPSGVPSEEIAKACGRAEKFMISGREVYLFCPNGYGRTKLSNAFLEKKLNLLATTRNWRTVNAIYQLSLG
jgi:uncharacterized protein (DUF1697 family)